MSITVAETSRLVLRVFQPEDVGDFYRIVSDSENMKFWPTPFDRPKAEGWIERSIENYSQSRLSRFAVVFKQSGKLIGDCGFIRLNVNGHDEWDLGYILDMAYWGEGLATEAALAALEYGKSVGLKRIVANMATDHLASKRVAEKIGMTMECTFNNTRNRNLPTFLLAWSNV